MKKTDFFIAVYRDGKPAAQKVSGYYEYMAGLPIGLHKVSEHAWNATELTTGLRLVTEPTRAAALNKAANMAGDVLRLLNDDIYAKTKKMISEAYNN
jgi:hypothetical protein